MRTPAVLIMSGLVSTMTTLASGCAVAPAPSTIDSPTSFADCVVQVEGQREVAGANGAPQTIAVSHGSAVILDPVTREVITAEHVVRDTDTVYVRLGNEMQRASVVAVDRGRDVALMKLEGPIDGCHRALDLAPRIVDGEPLTVVGYAPDAHTRWTSQGTVVAGRQFERRGTRLQPFLVTNAFSQEGFSGGGAFTTRGQLAGMTLATRSTGSPLTYVISGPTLAGVVPYLRRGQLRPHASLGWRLADQPIRHGSDGQLLAHPQLLAVSRSVDARAIVRAQPGDLVVAINGRPVHGTVEVAAVLDELEPGAIAEVCTRRDDRLVQSLVPLVAEPPQATSTSTTTSEGQP